MNSAVARPVTKELIVDIERILPGGFGLAHSEELTLFVPLTAPGDVVRVQIDRVQGKIAFAIVKEVIKGSKSALNHRAPTLVAVVVAIFNS